MKAKLVQKQEITEGTLYTKFSLDEKIDFEAGQFFKITLLDPVFVDERGSSRYMGFINSPGNNGVVETVTRLGPSAFKRSLVELPEGEIVEISGVSGEMTLPKDTDKPLLIVAGGIGIVPYISMFRFMREKSLSYKVTLIYSNTKQFWAPFMDELSFYAESENFTFIPIMTQDDLWQGEKRRIDDKFLKECFKNMSEGVCYVSGTPRFVPSIVTAVKSVGIDQKNLKFEIFTGY